MAALSYRIDRYGAVASTNDLARQAAARGDLEGLWIVASEQTAGRGRHGRSWQSPPGNFYGSLLLRPRASLETTASLSLVMGLSVAQAVHDLSGGRVEVRVKWPNDALVERRKLAGVLLEGEAEASGAARWLVIGVGVNLARAPGDAPHATTSLRTSLAAVAPGTSGASVASRASVADDPTADDLADRLLPAFAENYVRWRRDGFASLREEWLRWSAHRPGDRIRLRVQGTEIDGRFERLEENGTLLLRSDDDTLRSFATGELYFA